MIIYGVALLSGCLLVGLVAGDLLGWMIGVDANVGGVGIAMLLLLFSTSLSRVRFAVGPMTRDGITFWSGMYIPIVVAMAAKQDVLAALSSGWMAIVAGVAAVAASFALVPVLARIAAETNDR